MLYGNGCHENREEGTSLIKILHLLIAKVVELTQGFYF